MFEFRVAGVMSAVIVGVGVTFRAYAAFDVVVPTGKDFYVSLSGKDSNPGTCSEPFKSIGAGVAAAIATGQNGYTVWVDEGRYVTDAPITVTNKTVLIRAVSDDPSRTVIDAGGLHLGVSMQTASTLSGFTVSNALGGVSVALSTGSPVDGLVTNCIIEKCSGAINGGGIHSSGGRIFDCLVRHCSATKQGGGIWSNGGRISAVTVVSNRTADVNYTDGGGIFAKNKAVVENCLIVCNRTATNVVDKVQGGGIALQNSVLSNCVICGNAGLIGGGIGAAGTYEIVNCLVENNVSYDNGAALGATWDNGVISGKIEGCVFRANVTGGKNGAQGVLYPGSSTQASGFGVRNCLFDRNLAKNTICNYCGATGFECLVESCTFMNNTNKAGRTVMHQGVNDSKTIKLKNCLFSGTVCEKDTYAAAPDVSYVVGYEANYTHSFTPDGAGLPTDPVYGNVLGHGSAKIADAAAGNPQLRGASPCRDAGVYQSWMANSRDMGTGAFMIHPCGRFGVAPVVVGSHKRELGKAPDIGCAEYLSLGLLLLIH